jgi:hypothetical protein
MSRASAANLVRSKIALLTGAIRPDAYWQVSCKFFSLFIAALTHALPQVRFFSVPDCVAAQQKMHGRFFAKRQILTEYLNVDDFDLLKKDTGK